MDVMKESLILNAICLVLALGALAVAVYNVITGQVMSTGVDGLFLTLMCLMLALVFAINPLLALRSGPLRDLLKGRQKGAAEAEKPTDEKKKLATQ
jgi:hypothetical protein